jgi:flagellar assembly protein FliH
MLQVDGVVQGELEHSLFQGLPVSLLEMVMPGVQHISRLQFAMLDRSLVAAVPEMKGSPADVVGPLREEIAALEAQLRRQALEARGEVEMTRLTSRSDARAEWEAELNERLTVEREVVMQTCDKFRDERDKYFASVEGEVVRLSLAIAQRVLHREATIDPVMLASAVRVALERVKDESGVVLRVSALDVRLWRDVIAKDNGEVELVADDALSEGECVLETSVGRAELGVKAQLEEIERGFFDLLERRPA